MYVENISGNRDKRPAKKSIVLANLIIKGQHNRDGSLITVSNFSYAPIFQGPYFLTKILESNILYDNLFIDILSV